MQNCNYFHKFMVAIILIMIFCNQSEGTCGHHKHHHAKSTTPKCDFKIDTIITSNPEINIDSVKCSSKDTSKIFYVLKKATIPKEINRNELIKTIIKDLQGHAHKTTATTTHPNELIKTIIKALQGHAHKTTARPITTTTPHQSTNLQVTNHVVNGNSYVYNIQNHGTHYHYYGSSSTDKSNAHKIDIVPLEENKPNGDHKKNVWSNDVKLS